MADIAAVDYICLEERTKITHTFNATDSPFPSSKCMHHLFDESVQAHLHSTALLMEIDGRIWTYEKLNRCSNAIAKHLLRYLTLVSENIWKTNILLAMALQRDQELD